MPALYRQRIKLGLAIIMLAAILAMFLVPIPTLLVGEQNEDEPVLAIPMVWDKTFYLEFTHSVLKTPVQEYFILAPDNTLLLTSTTYKSLGVGLPFLPEEGELENKDGLFVLKGLNRKFNTINQAFNPITKQALVYRGKQYYYQDYFKTGALVRVQMTQYTPVKLIRQNILQ
ncbi:DUF1850 domain-containing protein [Peptococcaceae bacterium 1198_IL3148]